MSVKFDRLEIEFPFTSVEIVEENMFSIINKEGEISCLSYIQKLPYYYRLTILPSKYKAYLEFTGKALLEEYPNLIEEENLYQCLTNINNNLSFHLNIDEIISDGIVTKADVTYDISSRTPIKEIYKNLSLTNFKRYIITDLRDNQFAIKTTGANKRSQTRLVVYDKSIEIKTNKEFLQSIKNTREQLQYFSDKIRLELNLESKDRIRYFLDIEGETTIFKVLSSSADPIEKFLNMAIADNKELMSLKSYSQDMKDLYRLLLLCLCNWDLSYIERFIREFSHPRSNIKKMLKPFIGLKERITIKVLTPEDDKNLITISQYLKYLIHESLPQREEVGVYNLKELYHRNGKIESYKLF